MLDRLVRTIELSQKNLTLLLLRCNYKFLRDKIVNQLEEVCPFKLEKLDLNPSDRTLYTNIKNKLKNPHPQALMVFGLESVSAIDEVISASNFVREEFSKNFHFPLLLWVDDKILEKMIRLAPDFESWTTTFEFEISSEDLVDFIEQITENIFERFLEFGASQFFPKSAIPDVCDRPELEFALQDLKNLNLELKLELEARLKFLLGLCAYGNNQIEQAQSYYKQSLEFWQRNHRLKEQGCLLYNLGLAKRKEAAMNQFKYQQFCNDAQIYYQQCVDTFKRDENPELVAKFINALGEVLAVCEQWDELEEIAQQAFDLHKKYYNPLGLAYACGLLAKIELQNKRWEEAKNYAEHALKILQDYQLQDSEDERLNQSIDLNREKQNNKGWYLLLVATAQQHLGQTQKAIEDLENAAELGNRNLLEYYIYIPVLEKLQELYKNIKNYRQAFNIKRKQYSVEMQYGFRAFIGAGYLPSRTVLIEKEYISKISPEIKNCSRNLDVQKLVQRISKSRHKLTIIYGRSGAGKTSLINAGLLPALEHKGNIGHRNIFPPIVVRKYHKNEWRNEFSQSLTKALKRTRNNSIRLKDTSLEDIVQLLKNNENSNLLTILIFDQFEEFLSTCNSLEEKRQFYEFLGKCLEIVSIKIIICIREEYLHYLLEIDRFVNDSVIQNLDILSKDILYRLGNFSKEDAISVIKALTEQTPTPLESSLVEQIVEDLSYENHGEVRPIELQIVGAELEEKKITTIADYCKLGSNYNHGNNNLKTLVNEDLCQSTSNLENRLKTLINLWIERVIEDCGAENEEAAWKVLYLLTHETGIRTLKTKNELRTVLKFSDKHNHIKDKDKCIKFILRVLVDSGILFRIWEKSEYYYQLVHDYLVVYIRKAYNQKFEKQVNKEQDKIDKYMNHIRSGDYFQKLEAAINLAELDSSQVAKSFRNLLENYQLNQPRELGLRWHILETLSHIGANFQSETNDVDVREIIMQKGLNDPETAIQAHAVKLLGQLRYKPAKDILLSKCDHKQSCVRIQARWATMQLGEKPPELLSNMARSNLLLAYILIKCSKNVSDGLKEIEKLRFSKTCGVIEGGIISGEYDVIIKVIAENMESFNELVIGRLQGLDCVKTTLSLIVVNEPPLYYWSRRCQDKTPKFIAYAMIKVNTLGAGSLVACLRDLSEVSEAAAVYGQSDVVTKIEVSDPVIRDRIIAENIRRIPSVDSTQSYFVMSSSQNCYWNNSKEFDIPEEWFVGLKS